MIQKGKDINIMINGSIVAVAKSCDIQMNNETIEVSSPSVGTWKTFKPSRSSWSISISRFVQTVTNDLDLIGQEVSIVVTMMVNGTRTSKMTGSAIVTDCQSSYQVGSMATGSMNLQGSGALTKLV